MQAIREAQQGALPHQADCTTQPIGYGTSLRYGLEGSVGTLQKGDAVYSSVSIQHGFHFFLSIKLGVLHYVDALCQAAQSACGARCMWNRAQQYAQQRMINALLPQGMLQALNSACSC
jgi:hypothetical protein